jgi:hypothetical protein
MTTPKSEIRTANKELVDALLGMNTRNRHIRKGVVSRYVRDIQNGKWVLTNQGIGISSCGVLVDGQHRLEAIKAAGYPPVPLLLVSGLDLESQTVVDQQAKRSARDILQFAFNARVSRAAPAIANVILKSQSNWRGGYLPTMTEVMDCINEWAEEIELVAETPKSANFFAAPYLASFVLGIRLYQQDHVQSFIQRVESGEMLQKNMPEYHLRNLIVTTRKTGAGYAAQVERFQKCSKALESFVKGKDVYVLRA